MMNEKRKYVLFFFFTKFDFHSISGLGADFEDGRGGMNGGLGWCVLILICNGQQNTYACEVGLHVLTSSTAGTTTKLQLFFGCHASCQSADEDDDGHSVNRTVMYVLFR